MTYIENCLWQVSTYCKGHKVPDQLTGLQLSTPDFPKTYSLPNATMPPDQTLAPFCPETKYYYY